MILSIIEISEQEGYIHKCPLQWIQRGMKGPLHCPLFSSQEWMGSASKQNNLVSFLHRPGLFKSLPPLPFPSSFHSVCYP